MRSPLRRAIVRSRRALAVVLPPAEREGFPPLRALLPRHGLHLGASLLLLFVFYYFIALWLDSQWNFLFDPAYQTDDARTMIFPFHRYGPEGALASDPIAHEMMAFAPPAWWALYRLLVPAVGLFTATKVVQALCLAIIFWAGALLARSRRGGLAPAVLLVFMLLHTQFIVGRIGGGLPRGFAFPLFALWGAGAIVGSLRVRALSAVLGALLYPTTMVLILGGEGVLTVLGGADRGDGRPGLAGLGLRLGRYAVVVAACVALVLPFLLGGDVGTVHTFEQARVEPAFEARLGILPFADPIAEFARHLISPFNDPGGARGAIGEAYLRHGSTGALLFVTLLLLLPAARLSPPKAARGAIAFLGSAVVCYAIARVFAFRLYSPERYYSFGMPMVTILLVVGTVGQIAVDRPRWWTPAARNGAAALFIVAVLLLTGDGLRRDNMMNTTRPVDSSLFDFIRALPKDVRIAAHPHDADNIPLWTARATTGGYETLQPWLVKPWRRAKRRTQATLGALYASGVDSVARYARQYQVTHFLINAWRYGSSWRFRARVFEPFNSYLARIFRGRTRAHLLFARVPEEAVVFRHGRYSVVDVERLLRAMRDRGPASPAGTAPGTSSQPVGGPSSIR